MHLSYFQAILQSYKYRKSFLLFGLDVVE